MANTVKSASTVITAIHDWASIYLARPVLVQVAQDPDISMPMPVISPILQIKQLFAIVAKDTLANDVTSVI